MNYLEYFKILTDFSKNQKAYLIKLRSNAIRSYIYKKEENFYKYERYYNKLIFKRIEKLKDFKKLYADNKEAIKELNYLIFNLKTNFVKTNDGEIIGLDYQITKW